MINKERIESILKKQDLADYRWINPHEIVVAQWVRVKCIFGCGNYGLAACPPNTPSVDECDRFFKEYKSGLIIRLNKFADKDSYPSDWSREMTNKLLDIEREIFLAGFQKVFLLNQARCSLCTDCSGNRAECKDKTKSRPTPESFAVDVYQTVRNAELDINVIANTPAEINKIAILLIE
jgi:predicted metal-binding protein